jgi:hypothetical protein
VNVPIAPRLRQLPKKVCAMKVLLFPISLIFEFFQARTACLVLVSTLMALPSAQGAMSASGGIVSDGVTSLQWDQCPLGLSTVTTPCDTGSAQTYIWTDALSQVVSLNASNGGAGYKGHNDWRLPNINELESLVKFDGYVSGAYIDATFPNTPVNGDSAGMGGGTWTSTTYAWNNQTSKAWAIGFGYGETKVGQKTADSLYVRLVRGGQTYAAYDSLALTAQTITFNNPGAQTFGTTPTLSASATSGLSVSFTSSTTGVCTITSGGALSFVSVGQCTINADQAGNGSFAAAPQVSRTFTVNQASQTITGFAPASPVVFGASPATLSASGGASGSPIVFATTSANTICTVTGNTVTFTGVGICNLTANQAAGGSYSAAPQVTASVTINAAGQAITGFAPASPVVFGASPATLSASGGASSSPIVFATTSANTICTVTGNTVTFTGVGICNLTANQAAGGSYSAAPQVTASVTINAAGQAITGFAPASPVVFGASPATLSASGGASGSPIVFATTSANTICTVTGNTVTFTGVGICNLTANQAAGGSYSAAPQVTASVTINAAGQAITGFAPASPVVFGASPATLSASGGASGSPIVFATTSANTICTVTGNTVTFTGVGICNLTANQAAGGSYSAAPQVTASVTINAAGQAITGFAPASPVVFGASPATLSASGGASGSPIVFATTSANTICTVTGNTVTFTGVGICNLTANQAAGGSYSAAPQVTASVTINAAGQAITGFAPASPVVFGASPATLSASGGASSSPIVFATTSANTICHRYWKHSHLHRSWYL